MLNKKEFIREEKDCALQLGMSLKEYRKYVKNSKVSIYKKDNYTKYDNTILKSLGLTISDLKTRKGI